MPLRGAAGSLDGLTNVPIPSPAPSGYGGTATWTTNQSLTNDVYYDKLTINPSLIIQMNGYGIFVKGDLTLGDAVVIRPLTAGAGGIGTNSSPGAAGTTRPAGTVGGGFTAAGAGNGSNSSTGLPSVGIMCGGGGGGGAGGEGGNSGGFGGLGGPSGGGGGASGVHDGSPGILASFYNQASAAIAQLGDMLSLEALLTGRVNVLGVSYPIYGGAGGGGGGQSGTHGGGGGGAGGGVARLRAGRILRSGAGTAPRIEALGGDGGTADGGGVANPGPGAAGGGGVIMIGYSYIDPTIVLDVSAGNPGQPANFSGTSKFGGAGGAGRIYKWEF